MIKAAAQNKINDFTPRVVSVASAAAKIGKVDYTYVDNQDKLPFFFQRYANSKLMNCMFIKKLSEVVKDDGIIAHAVHPGFVSTGKYIKRFERGINWMVLMLTTTKIFMLRVTTRFLSLLLE